jgi:hypothetical protein
MPLSDGASGMSSVEGQPRVRRRFCSRGVGPSSEAETCSRGAKPLSRAEIGSRAAATLE